MCRFRPFNFFAIEGLFGFQFNASFSSIDRGGLGARIALIDSSREALSVDVINTTRKIVKLF